MARIIQAFAQFFDNDGSPLINGWIEFYESGSNNTHKDTFYDSIYQIRNANPLQLDGSGRCPPIFGQGNYRAVLYKQNLEDETDTGEQVQVQDPVPSLSDGVGTGGGEGFQAWDNTKTYQIGDIVTVSGTYYRSLITDNLNNNPPLEPFAWEQVEFVSVWNDTISYNIGDLVRYDYELYFSKTSVNLNNQPDETPANWRRLDSGIVGTDSKTVDYEILPTDRDRLIILGNTTTADRTFTLPAVTASEDGFKIWIYNNSDYNLTLDALLAIPIWIDATNEIILEKGAFIEIRYSASLNIWMPKGNHGPTLGGQDLGTGTTPANNAYIDILTIFSSIQLPSDTLISFGTGHESSILYSSANNALEIYSSTILDIYADGLLEITATNTGMNIEANGLLSLESSSSVSLTFQEHFYLYRGTGLYWDFQSNGNLVPGVPNTNPNLGSASNPLKYIYIGNSGRIFLEDSNIAYFGSDQDMGIMHNGTHGYIDNSTGSLYFRTGSPLSDALILDASQNAFFGGQVNISVGNQLYFGNEGLIYNASSSSGLLISSLLAYPLQFATNSVTRWEISATGDIIPITTDTYSVGAGDKYLEYIYVREARSNICIAGSVYSDLLAATSTGLLTNPLEFGVNYGSLKEKTFELYDLGTSGADFILYVRYGGTDYKLTAIPA